MVTGTLTPTRVRVRMYQVGFGDAFLLTLEYASPGEDGRAERHLLFDLGSTHAPRHGSASMDAVAQLIAEHTHGQLDVVVVTHRHKDHLSGFGIHASSATLTGLQPKLVLRPWTEDPDLPAAATGPAALETASPSERFAAALAAAQTAVSHIASAAAAGHEGLHELAAAAERQLPNSDAIKTLDTLAADGRGRYLHAGTPLDLNGLVPGLTATVLGPPTPEQYPKVTGQASRDPEYWMLRLQRSLRAAARGQQTAGQAAGSPVTGAEVEPGPVRWLVERLMKQHSHSLTRLVRALDDALNNTSLILLLEVGGVSLLFPGDAQIENWRYTLDRLQDDPGLTARLAGIDLYKVGHHGSRNATPRSLYNLWARRPASTPAMTALMSTTPGVHGDTPATAVPRTTLIEALKQVADLHSTDDLPQDQPFLEMVTDATGGPFTVVARRRE